MLQELASAAQAGVEQYKGKQSKLFTGGVAQHAAPATCTLQQPLCTQNSMLYTCGHVKAAMVKLHLEPHWTDGLALD